MREIGLEDLIDGNFAKIGNKIQIPGVPVGDGLSLKAAEELNLLPGIPVGTSIIDAHAGGLGLIGCSIEGSSIDFETRLSTLINCSGSKS